MFVQICVVFIHDTNSNVNQTSQPAQSYLTTWTQYRAQRRNAGLINVNGQFIFSRNNVRRCLAELSCRHVVSNNIQRSGKTLRWKRKPKNVFVFKMLYCPIVVVIMS